jgi:hypothetical protein
LWPLLRITAARFPVHLRDRRPPEREYLDAVSRIQVDQLGELAGV